MAAEQGCYSCPPPSPLSIARPLWEGLPLYLAPRPAVALVRAGTELSLAHEDTREDNLNWGDLGCGASAETAVVPSSLACRDRYMCVYGGGFACEAGTSSTW